MKRQQRNILIIAASILIAVFLIQKQQPPPPTVDATPSVVVSVAPPVETQNALFARKKIDKNAKFDNATKISEFMDLRRDIPKDKLPKERVASSFSEVKDLIALDDIEKGEPIVVSRFARADEIGGLSHHMPEGMRAITLRVDKIRGVGGFISQGDLVDIIGSFTVEGKSLTKYVLTKVKILAVNSVYQAASTARPGDPSPEPQPQPQPSASPGSPNDPNRRDRITGQDVQLVTFEVTPVQAERIIVASENGRLYLVLRNPQDPDSPTVSPVDAVDVYVERPKKPPVPKYDIDLLKGNVRTAFGVRLESTGPADGTSGPKTYYQASEPNVRDLREEDFRAIR